MTPAIGDRVFFHSDWGDKREIRGTIAALEDGGSLSVEWDDGTWTYGEVIGSVSSRTPAPCDPCCNCITDWIAP